MKLINEKLKETQAELIHSEKLASLGRFSSGIAHEIRNPLANISALAQLITNQEIDPKLEKHLQYIQLNSDIANSIIKDLLNYAAPHNVNFAEISVNNLLDDLYKSVHSRCSKYNIKIETEILKEDKLIYGNEEKLQQAFMNFISNSIDAMPEGGSILISAKYDELMKEVIFVFSDTGTGIENENLDKILEPFFTTKNHGTGLGLSHAYQVLKAHTGKIEIESELNKGTKIIVRIPDLNNRH